MTALSQMMNYYADLDRLRAHFNHMPNPNQAHQMAALPAGDLWGKRARKVYKPDSVRGLPPWMIIHLTTALLRWRQLPTRTCWGKSSPAAEPEGLRHAIPIWHCSRWGLPYRRCCHRRGGLLPHRFTLTPADRGGLFSVALSVGLPRPGVTRHRCFLESGLSSTSRRRRDHPTFRAGPP